MIFPPRGKNHIIRHLKGLLQTTHEQVTGLSVGEFVGTTVESGQPYFWSRIKQLDLPNDDYSIPPFAKGIDTTSNFRQIKANVEKIICSYERKIEQQPSSKKRM